MCVSVSSTFEIAPLRICSEKIRAGRDIAPSIIPKSHARDLLANRNRETIIFRAQCTFLVILRWFVLLQSVSMYRYARNVTAKKTNPQTNRQFPNYNNNARNITKKEIEKQNRNTARELPTTQWPSNRSSRCSPCCCGWRLRRIEAAAPMRCRSATAADLQIRRHRNRPLTGSVEHSKVILRPIRSIVSKKRSLIFSDIVGEQLKLCDRVFQTIQWGRPNSPPDLVGTHTLVFRYDKFIIYTFILWLNSDLTW